MSSALTRHKRAPQFIVSTDLDGTFLDHHTYEWQAALPAVESLAAKSIPIIFNTSKTFAEVMDLQKTTSLYGPAITENGSALYLPKQDFTEAFCQFENSDYIEQENHWQIVFGKTKPLITQFIQQWRLQNGHLLEGYSDWTIEKIMQMTDLPQAKAQQSADKAFSEPFIWQGNEQQLHQLKSDAAKAGLQILQGGRFYHLQGNCDKGQPLLWLKRRFMAAFELDGSQAPKLICLGDNKNDIQMLNIADFPVCVKSPVAPYPTLTTQHSIIQTKGYGPVGWNEAIQSIIEQH
ncbi:Glucosyl-3-phosphoglycerate/mannosyl-3-phosphoglycerate phosphatase [Thalassocella blandensis]|nr:Glucosyl-3-phosphoglycerate/mannosyl-3-phosphoglycerate phosphatase [Thalassocella blandensis]